MVEHILGHGACPACQEDAACLVQQSADLLAEIRQLRKQLKEQHEESERRAWGNCGGGP